MPEPDVAFTKLDRDSQERFQTLRRDLGVSSFGMNLMLLQPRQRSRVHIHGQQEEVYLVLEGSGRIKVEDEIVDLAQWDAIRIPGGVTRALESGERGMTILAIGGNPTGDAEMLNGWWDG